MGTLQQLDVEMDEAPSARGLPGEESLLPRRKALLSRIDTLTQQVQAMGENRVGSNSFA